MLKAIKNFWHNPNAAEACGMKAPAGKSCVCGFERGQIEFAAKCSNFPWEGGGLATVTGMNPF
jgi:hypothetical protein